MVFGSQSQMGAYVDVSGDTMSGNLLLGTNSVINTGTANSFGDLAITSPSSIYSLSHDSFADFVANEHIDHSGVSISSGGILSGGGTIAASRTITLASSDVNHDGTTNFVANEHIDHSAVSVSAGGILSGGGTIAASRTITLASSDVDHDGTTNFAANEHIDWTSSSNAFSTTESVTADSDGSYTSIIGDSSNSRAAYFEDTDRTVEIADGSYGVEAVYSGYTEGKLAASDYGVYGYKDTSGSAGGYFTDSNAYTYVYLADGSYGVQAYSSSSPAGYFYDSSSNSAELAGGYPGYFYDTYSNYVYVGGGSDSYAITAYHSSSLSGAGYFSDSPSGNYAYIADSSYGVYGYYSSSGNYGSLGSSSYGVEGYASGGYAGYFSDTNSNSVQLADGSSAGYFYGTYGTYLGDGSYSINADGEIYTSSKMTSSGGYDPPYVLYDIQTRQQIIDRIKVEVPPDKQDGAALFFNKDTKQMETYIASEGKFYDISGNLIHTLTKPVVGTKYETLYHLDNMRGEIVSHQRTTEPLYKLKEGYKLDSKTGKIYDESRTEIPPSQAISQRGVIA